MTNRGKVLDSKCNKLACKNGADTTPINPIFVRGIIPKLLILNGKIESTSNTP